MTGLGDFVPDVTTVGKAAAFYTFLIFGLGLVGSVISSGTSFVRSCGELSDTNQLLTSAFDSPCAVAKTANFFRRQVSPQTEKKHIEVKANSLLVHDAVLTSPTDDFPKPGFRIPPFTEP